jgi:hypothetical protein
VSSSTGRAVPRSPPPHPPGGGQRRRGRGRCLVGGRQSPALRPRPRGPGHLPRPTPVRTHPPARCGMGGTGLRARRRRRRRSAPSPAVLLAYRSHRRVRPRSAAPRQEVRSGPGGQGAGSTPRVRPRTGAARSNRWRSIGGNGPPNSGMTSVISPPRWVAAVVPTWSTPGTGSISGASGRGWNRSPSSIGWCPGVIWSGWWRFRPNRGPPLRRSSRRQLGSQMPAPRPTTGRRSRGRSAPAHRSSGRCGAERRWSAGQAAHVVDRDGEGLLVPGPPPPAPEMAVDGGGDRGWGGSRGLVAPDRARGDRAAEIPGWVEVPIMER